MCGTAQAQSAGVDRIEHRVASYDDRTLLSAPIVQLVDPQRQRLAEILSARQRPLFFVSALLEMATLLWLWRSGRAASIRDNLRRRVGNVHVLRFTYVGTLAIVVSLAALPASFVGYRMGVVVGLSYQSPSEWLGGAVSTGIVNSILAGIVFTVMLALAQKTRLWYVFGAFFLVFFMLFASFAGPLVLAPWLHHQQPFIGTPLAERLAAIERKAGIGQVPIVLENIGQGARADVARVSGFGTSTEIVLSDTLVRDASPGELEFVVARASAHIAANDVLHLTLYSSLWLILAAALAVTISDRIGFRRDDDPLSRIALLGTFLGLAILLLLPVANAYSRRIEARADKTAIQLTNDPAGAVRRLVRAADINLIEVCPPPIVRRYFLTSPPIGTRIGVIRGTGDPCP